MFLTWTSFLFNSTVNLCLMVTILCLLKRLNKFEKWEFVPSGKCHLFKFLTLVCLLKNWALAEWNLTEQPINYFLLPAFTITKSRAKDFRPVVLEGGLQLTGIFVVTVCLTKAELLPVLLPHNKLWWLFYLSCRAFPKSDKQPLIHLKWKFWCRMFRYVQS